MRRSSNGLGKLTFNQLNEGSNPFRRTIIYLERFNLDMTPNIHVLLLFIGLFSVVSHGALISLSLKVNIKDSKQYKIIITCQSLILGMAFTYFWFT